MKNTSKWLLERLKTNKVLFSDCQDLTEEQSLFIMSFAKMAFKYGVDNHIPSCSFDYDIDYPICDSVVVKIEDTYVRITSIVRKDLLVVYGLIEPVEFYAKFEDILENNISERLEIFKISKFKDSIMEYISKYDISEEDFLKVKDLIF